MYPFVVLSVVFGKGGFITRRVFAKSQKPLISLQAGFLF